MRQGLLRNPPLIPLIQKMPRGTTIINSCEILMNNIDSTFPNNILRGILYFPVCDCDSTSLLSGTLPLLRMSPKNILAMQLNSQIQCSPIEQVGAIKVDKHYRYILSKCILLKSPDSCQHIDCTHMPFIDCNTCPSVKLDELVRSFGYPFDDDKERKTPPA